MPKYTTSDDESPTVEPDLDRFYGNLRNYVKMVGDGYTNLLILDAKGGLGKTHTVREVLSEECEASLVHQKGFTTPIELYKTLWQARQRDTVLFLDDMSGVTNNTKAIDMLKAATDTEGEENVVEYRTSRDIDHPHREGETLPNTFTFRATVVMSFNDTPDNRHFDALLDRGTYYNFTLSYHERIELIEELAKLPDFSNLSITEQREVAEWVKLVTDPSFEVTIRTFEEVCKMRQYGQDMNEDWEKMALEVFDLDYEEHIVLQMREQMDMSIEEQVESFIERTGTSESHYYDIWDSVRDKRES